MKTKVIIYLLAIASSSSSLAQDDFVVPPPCGQYTLLKQANAIMTDVSASLNKVKKNIVIEKYLEAFGQLQSNYESPVDDFISEVSDDAETIGGIASQGEG